MEKLCKLTDYVVSLSWRRFVDKFAVVFNYELVERIFVVEQRSHYLVKLGMLPETGNFIFLPWCGKTNLFHPNARKFSF